MKKNVLITCAAIGLILLAGQFNLRAQCVTSTPIISEIFWPDGPDGPSYAEIYNGTSEAVDMSEYQWVMCPSGTPLTDQSAYNWGTHHLNGFPVTDPVTGTPAEGAEDVILQPGDIYLFVSDIAWDSLATEIANLPENVTVHKGNWNAQFFNWGYFSPVNGIMYIAKNQNDLPIVDFVGVPGGTQQVPYGWGQVGNVLIRNEDVRGPAAEYAAWEWTITPGPSYGNMGRHSLGCVPEVKVRIGDKVITEGSTTNIGNVAYGAPTDVEIIIENGSYHSVLELESPTATVSGDISLTKDAYKQSLSIPDTTRVIVTFNPGAEGTTSGTVTIPSSDPDSPFTFTIEAEATSPFIWQPEIGETELCNGDGADLDVSFRLIGTLSGNIEVQLSDASGNFSAATVIGTTSDLTEGDRSITANVPNTVPSGTGYRVRIHNASYTSNPNIQDITVVQVSANDVEAIIDPDIEETIVTGGEGKTRICFGKDGVDIDYTYQWGYRTVSGGEITDFPGATEMTFTPKNSDFPSEGVFYLVCTAVANCGGYTAISNEVTLTVEEPSALSFGNETGLSVFPNPANSELHISSESDEKMYIRISDLRGVIVTNQVIEGSSVLDISNLTSGNYILTITTQNNIVNEILVVE